MVALNLWVQEPRGLSPRVWGIPPQRHAASQTDGVLLTGSWKILDRPSWLSPHTSRVYFKSLFKGIVALTSGHFRKYGHPKAGGSWL